MQKRNAPIKLSGDEFRKLGHQLVNDLGALLDALPDKAVTPGEVPSTVRKALPTVTLPQFGMNPEVLIKEATNLLAEHSLFNSHPRFAGYVTSPPAPVGILAELLAATINANVGAWILAPMATEIEQQTIAWIAELIGYPTDCGGILVSGGNMANFVGFLAARHAKAPRLREEGLSSTQQQPQRIYASKEVHTWLQKAADLFGFGTKHIRWISTTNDQIMDCDALEKTIEDDIAHGDRPFLVVASAGTVSTGAIDPLVQIRAICDKHALWLHVDGAYGAFAAVAPDCPETLNHLQLADSIALDPHKWLYAPLEAGCALVKDRELMQNAFSYSPPYYKMGEVGGEETIDYVNFGPQNSRGFKALKVWMALRHVGRAAYARMIADDMRLSRLLFDLANGNAELQALTNSLSITTFRYVPRRLDMERLSESDETYLNELNLALLTMLQESGKVFVSNAVVNNRYLLRACIVNFRTDVEDIQAIIDTVIEFGRIADASLI